MKACAATLIGRSRKPEIIYWLARRETSHPYKGSGIVDKSVCRTDIWEQIFRRRPEFVELLQPG